MKDKNCTQIPLCFLLTAAMCLEANVLKKEMSLAPRESWKEARRFCRKEAVDLMPFDIAKELQVKKSLWKRGVDLAWIGNYIGSPDGIRTINIKGGNSTIWFPSSPNLHSCGFLNTRTGKMNFDVCSFEFEGVCLSDNLELVKEKKTWEEALQHCRDKSKCDERGVCKFTSSLLMLKNPADYDYVRDRIYAADTDEVWTGLRFLGGEWFWVDGEELKDEGELPRCPSQRKHCGTLSKTSKTKWLTRDCSEKRNFVCTYSMSRVKELE